MTMVQPQNQEQLMSRLQGYNNELYGEACLLGSDLVLSNHSNYCNIRNTKLEHLNNNNISMGDQDESRTNSDDGNQEVGSSSRDFQEDDDQGNNWLQLSIGGPKTTSTTTTTRPNIDHDNRQDQDQNQPGPGRGGGIIELDLLQGNSFNTNTTNLLQHETRPPLTLQSLDQFRPPRPISTSSNLFQHQQGNNYVSSNGSGNNTNTTTIPLIQPETAWQFRPIPSFDSIPMQSSSSRFSSSLLQLGSSYFPRLGQSHSGNMVLDEAGPSSDYFRVIDPPKRSHSGIWFMLQASLNQTKEPYLPQVSKSYLRIKDGKMTVKLLMKYLVNKLKLESELEVVITCRGQQLEPYLTLQHVRDSIWSSRGHSVITLLPHSSTTTTPDHVMVLQYGRIA